MLFFLIKFHESVERLNKRINSYIKNANEKNIHDVRTSVRRFNAVFLTLPKKYRTESNLLYRYNQIAIEFFKVNSKIRDYDIIIQKLNNYVKNNESDLLIEAIKKTRQSSLENAKILAISLKDVGSNNIFEKMNITEKELQKQYNKILLKLVSRIESDFPTVISDSTRIDELHELRKNCKKMRYMLELLPEEDKGAMEIKRSFEKIQDYLGSIHDYDITRIYLQSQEPSETIQEIINNQIEMRRLRYEEFLKFAKRRLHISKDSFLIKIKLFLF